MQIIAQGYIRIVRGGDFHQPARYIDRIADGCDVLMAFAAEPGRYDLPEMSADLESDMGCN